MSDDIYVKGQRLAEALDATGGRHDAESADTVRGLCDEIVRVQSAHDEQYERADDAERELARVRSSRLAALAEGFVPALVARQPHRRIVGQPDPACPGSTDTFTATLSAEQVAEIREQAFTLARAMLGAVS